ncbi:hypothetical protein HY415_02245 [Candidatus Kaiserbacteria bacterium]|nr:hypothetical protein [Candidatus Kaiserbacteria bacterium]
MITQLARSRPTLWAKSDRSLGLIGGVCTHPDLPTTRPISTSVERNAPSEGNTTSPIASGKSAPTSGWARRWSSAFVGTTIVPPQAVLYLRISAPFSGSCAGTDAHERKKRDYHPSHPRERAEMQV